MLITQIDTLFYTLQKQVVYLNNAYVFFHRCRSLYLAMKKENMIAKTFSI